MYFGNDSSIAYMSPDAAARTMLWCVLTNTTITNAQFLRGSLCFDQTGTWSNNLIAVTSDEAPDLFPHVPKQVWLIPTNAQPSLLAQINTGHLEGVATMPNDTNRWGPWAGTILTGDEDAHNDDARKEPLIFSISTNGNIARYSLGIEPEDFKIIQPDQDLYCINYNGANYGANSRVLKVSRSVLQNFTNDLLIVQAGEYNPYGYYPQAPKLFIVHWTGTNFLSRSIPLPTQLFPGSFEHVTFAPVDLPNIQQQP